MSTATEITRLQTARNTIRNKMVELGLGTSTDKLDDLATEISAIANKGAVGATVKEGETYTIPAGYHNGSGTVQGVAGGGNYSLQAKSATPTKSQQSITADSGYYGLSSVTVAAIPAAYQDVTSVTATAGDVLATKIIVDSEGNVTAGSMPNNGAVSRTLTTASTSYTVPAGYHNGSGTVSIVTESKSVTPSLSEQTVTPTTGKVLSSVVVDPIPDNYIDTSDATATSADILEGATAYVDGELVEGTIPYVSPGDITLDTTDDEYTIDAGYHEAESTVSVLWAEIDAQNAIVPTTSQQTIYDSNGAFLKSVVVGAIPSAYHNTSDATAAA